MGMKSFGTIIILAGFLGGCSQNSAIKENEAARPEDLTRQAVSLAESFAKGQLNEARRMTTGQGSITWADKRNMFVMEPQKIFTGLVDDDPEKDAIVSLAAFQGQNQIMTRHLILISAHGKLALEEVIESDMEILWIKNGVITAEVPTHPRNSPLFNCSECRDVVYYRFQGGELVRVE
jgi:hypothetical protein